MIPEVLTTIPNWVLHKEKRPFQPNGTAASTTDKKTWSSFGAVCVALKNDFNRFDGMGFVFTKEAGIVGIDLDGLKTDGALPAHLTDFGRELIARFNSFTEVSPSGSGVHIYIRATLPEHGRKFNMEQHSFKEIELYDCGRFFTVTHNHLANTPITIEPRQAELDSLLDELTVKPPKPMELSLTHAVLSNVEILDKCRNAKNADKFERLWSGDSSDYGGDESRADAALCSILAFYTRDKDQIDSLFRQSGLMRDKWNRTDYRNLTINNSMKRVSDVYTPHRNGEHQPNGSNDVQSTEMLPNGTGRAHSPEEPKPTRIATIEKFLSARYEFRLNEVTHRIEFRPNRENGEQTPFKAAAEFELNSMERELLHNNLSTRSLMKLLTSDFVPLYNPFTEFLQSLPKWDGEYDYITMFFNLTVCTRQSEDVDYQTVAAGYFKKWLVAMLSCWRGTGNIREVNQTMLVFTGAQGAGKTTWQTNLMPPSLRDYLYVGSFDATNRDNLVLLSDKGLIIFDELDSLRGQTEAVFKQAISRATITARRAYARSNEDYPRRASFIGSLNHAEFLGDTTGTRRFLVVEVESINNESVKSFPLEMIYAQAFSLLESGFQYWLSSAEINALNKRNARYATLSIEEDLVLTHIVRGDDFLSATEIVERIAPYYKSQKINSNKIGAMLKKHGYERVQKRIPNSPPHYGYFVNFKGLPTMGYYPSI